MPHIVIVNRTTLATPLDVQRYAEAQQRQLSRDFCPAWFGVDADISVLAGDRLPAGTWPLILCDEENSVPGALGWHSLGGVDLPIGVVPLRTSITHGEAWTATASHEVLEMIADPACHAGVLLSLNRKPCLVALEVADPVENDEYTVEANDGTPVLMSNFVFPRWFSPPPHTAGSRFDFLGKLKSCFPAMSPGGYFAYSADLRRWQQQFGDLPRPHQRTAHGRRQQRFNRPLDLEAA